MDKLALLKKLSKTIPEKDQKNPYWKFEPTIRHQHEILHSDGTPLAANDFTFLIPILDYFRLVYKSFKTEAQVVVVLSKDKNKIDKSLLRLPFKNDKGLRLVVLPQENTAVSSIVPEEIWQKYIVDRGIIPYARVHSHCTFDAYQSAIDYSTLNSGSLEIVIGHIFDDPSFCYWLDEKGKQTKSFSFKAPFSVLST